MCLITRKQEPKISSKDIPVWKILGNASFAKHFKFKYVLNTLNKTTMKLVPRKEDYEMYTNKGWKTLNQRTSNILHIKFNSWDVANHKDRDKLICISQGFHAYTKKKTAKRDSSNGDVVVKFIIPKGAKYYKDICDCIVSNQIKMVE